jgi:signal transduction histidine kinase
LEDSEGSLNFAEVISPQVSKRFTPHRQQVFNPGITSSVFWLRLDLRSTATNEKDWLLVARQASISYLDLYLPDGEGGFSAIQTGEKLPMATRPVNHRYFVFPLQLGPGQVQTLYLRLASDTSTYLPLSIWKPGAFYAADQQETIIASFFYGALGILLVYHLLLFVGSRDPSYFFLSALIASFILVVLTDGFGKQYLWPNSPYTSTIGAAGGTFTLAMDLAFTTTALSTRRRLPGFHRLLLVALGAWLVLTASLALAGTSPLVYSALLVMIVPTYILLVVTAALVLRQGYQPARYLVAAWLVLLAGMSVFVLDQTGILPHSRFAEYGVQLSALALVLLLAYTQVDRINSLALEKVRANTRLQESILEREKAEAEVRQLNQELEARVHERTIALAAKNHELETFTYSISHDLKAPLRSISGYANILLEDYCQQLDQQGQDFLGHIQTAARRMSEMIEGLLKYSRLERLNITYSPVELSGLVQGILGDYGETMETRGIELRVDLPAEVFLTDAGAISQALRNLIDNAVKFTQGVPHPHIEITGQLQTNHCLVCVRDNGIGFNMQYAEKIFEIFQRLQPSEEVPGTGIGLALVRKAMQRLGGRVWAESTPGEGSAFYLEIPRFPAQLREATRPRLA